MRRIGFNKGANYEYNSTYSRIIKEINDMKLAYPLTSPTYQKSTFQHKNRL